MITTQALKELITKRKQENREAAARAALEEEAWDNGVCPNCGSYSVKEISYHELSGTSRYRCYKCGAKGYGGC